MMIPRVVPLPPFLERQTYAVMGGRSDQDLGERQRNSEMAKDTVCVFIDFVLLFPLSLWN